MNGVVDSVTFKYDALQSVAWLEAHHQHCRQHYTSYHQNRGALNRLGNRAVSNPVLCPLRRRRRRRTKWAQGPKNPKPPNAGPTRW